MLGRAISRIASRGSGKARLGERLGSLSAYSHERVDAISTENQSPWFG